MSRLESPKKEIVPGVAPPAPKLRRRMVVAVLEEAVERLKVWEVLRLRERPRAFACITRSSNCPTKTTIRTNTIRGPVMAH